MTLDSLRELDALTVEVISDNVSDTYVTKTPPFAASEFDNVVKGGTKTIAGESLLVANLGYGLRLRSRIADDERAILFDAGTEPRPLSATAKKISTSTLG